MSKPTFVSIEWQKWIRENLARGCTAQSLVDTMVNNQFDRTLARATVEAESAQSTASAKPSATGFRYETPRFPMDVNTIVTSDRTVHVSMRMTRPVVAVLDNLFTHEECDELVRLSRIKLQRSTTVDPQTGREIVIQDRTSSGTFFPLNETPFITMLDRRIAEVMHWPVENGEGIQILNYQVGGEYKPHFDYFPPEDPGSKPHLDLGGQRVSTLVMYLNEVEAGGETLFPNLNLSVVPKKGSAVYFEYTNSLSQVDPDSLHAGNPVVRGEKWIATKWMRERRYGG